MQRAAMATRAGDDGPARSRARHLCALVRAIAEAHATHLAPRSSEWEDVARSQGTVNLARLRAATPGTTFALEDRNTMIESWRRVFVVIPTDGEEHALVYDARWELIDEPSAGVANGKHVWVDFLDEFGDPESEPLVFYRAPHLRRTLIRSPNAPRSPAGAECTHTRVGLKFMHTE